MQFKSPSPSTSLSLPSSTSVHAPSSLVAYVPTSIPRTSSQAAAGCSKWCPCKLKHLHIFILPSFLEPKLTCLGFSSRLDGRQACHRYSPRWLSSNEPADRNLSALTPSSQLFFPLLAQNRRCLSVCCRYDALRSDECSLPYLIPASSPMYEGFSSRYVRLVLLRRFSSSSRGIAERALDTCAPRAFSFFLSIVVTSPSQQDFRAGRKFRRIGSKYFQRRFS